MLPATIVRALPDYVLSCSATGTPPIYTAMIRKKKRKNRILVNTTSTPSIRLKKDGNYICVATNEYGIDQKEFSVILKTGTSIFISNTKVSAYFTFLVFFRRVGLELILSNCV